MNSCREKAYAKLNLSLDVTGKREDGYHDMAMVMQSVSLHDEVTVSLSEEDDAVRASCNLRFIPCDERNLAVRAALLYREETGERRGVHIELKKNIPVGAGMAGGSTDAAAVLRAMNRLCGRRLSREELEKLAAKVGSDVAFCVSGGTSLARGRGEELTPLTPLPDCAIVIGKPEFSISTPELFKKLDRSPLRRHPDTAGLLRAIGERQLREICRRMYNVFEEVDDRRIRMAGEIKGRLLDFGALSAIMTGTGSAVFGVFDQEERAEAACEALKGEYRFVCLARPVDRLL